MIEEMRRILRNWGTYGPHYDDAGALMGCWFERLPVDDMTDEEIREVVEKIVKRKAKPAA